MNVAQHYVHIILNIIENASGAIKNACGRVWE